MLARWVALAVLGGACALLACGAKSVNEAGGTSGTGGASGASGAGSAGSAGTGSSNAGRAGSASNDCDPSSPSCGIGCFASTWDLETNLPKVLGTTPCPDGLECAVTCTNTYFECTGYCYHPCDEQTGEGCPAGFMCSYFAGSVGATTSSACVKLGTGVDGEPCESTPGYTDCAEGHRCAGGSPGVCEATCDFWSADPGCPAGLVCTLMYPDPRTTPLIPSGVCIEYSGDNAPLGEPCPEQPVNAGRCGFDGVAYRGACQNPCVGVSCEGCEFCPPSRSRCQPHCRSGSDCPDFYPSCNLPYGYCSRYPPPPPE